MVGGTKFYSRKEIRDLIAYLTIVANPADNISFERIVNEPKRGVGPGTLDKLRQFAYEWPVFIRSSFKSIDVPLKGKAAQAIMDLANILGQLRQDLDQMSITDLAEALLEKQVI